MNKAQNTPDSIKKYAIPFRELSEINHDFYAYAQNFKCICVGEMHGTNEPAAFVLGLAETFALHQRKLLIGIEIEDSLMNGFAESRNINMLSKTRFFGSSRNDGKNSEAWLKMIEGCAGLPVTFCFFDDADDAKMAKNLMDCYMRDTLLTIITLSGNIHNRLEPFRNNKTMSCYLKERFGGRVCSINHIYNEGSMYNNTGNGATLHNIPASQNVLGTSTHHLAYFIPNIFKDYDLSYTGFIFSRIVSASMPVTK